MYDDGAETDDYLAQITDPNIAKGNNQLTPILSKKCFELTEPNFGSIKCSDEGTVF